MLVKGNETRKEVVDYMELDKIIYDYKACCKVNDKWYKENQPQYMKCAKTSLFVAGGIALVMLFATFLLKSAVTKALVEVLALAIMGFAFLRIQKYIEKNETAEDEKDDNESSEMCLATRKKYKRKQAESLKEILINNNVVKNSFDNADVERIQLLIDLIRERKVAAIGLNDLNLFLAKPIAVFVAPAIVVFLDHLTSEQNIIDQLVFFLNLIAVVMMFGIIFYMIADPIRYFAGRRYDRLIDELRALLVFYQ